MVFNHYCVAPHCNSRITNSVRPEDLVFHNFPRENERKVLVETDGGSKELMDRRQAWIFLLKIKKPLVKHSKVCSLHFKKEDYFPARIPSHRYLKRNAVPSQNLDASPVIQKKKENKNIEECSDTLGIKQALQECEGLQRNISNNNSAHDLEAAHALLNLFKVEPDADVKILRNILEGNMKYSPNIEEKDDTSKICTLYHFLKKDETLKYFTGLGSFDNLNKIIQLVEKEYEDEDCQEFSTAEKIILVLTKIKLNLSFTYLSLLFNISVDLCEQYFHQMLKILGSVLKPVICSGKQNSRRLFGLKNFKGVCTILDCIEILIQKPSCRCCQIRFYSQCKSHTTVKFMIGRSPGGTITYVSEPFGGKASNRSIFRHSDIISNFENDAIIVNQDFDIEDLCENHGIELLTPSSRRKRMSTKKELLNSEIVTTLLHNKKNNEKLRNFKILDQELEWSLVPFVGDIFIVVCSVRNLLRGECFS